MRVAAFNALREIKRSASAFIERAGMPLSIRGRIAMLVLAFLLPMNALIVAAIVKLDRLSTEAEYTRLQYTANVIASAVEARLARHLAVARALAA